jgi:uncharacterized protein YggE
MKKYFLVFLLFPSLFVAAQTKSFIDQPYIEVAGAADTLVTPDRIFVKIILSEKDTRDRLSVEELENKMIAALNNLSINIEEDLVLSDMLSAYKIYLLKQKDIIKTKEYTLKVSNASLLSKVFVSLENIGISNVSIEKTELTAKEQIENICRSRAIENAKNKAISYTKSLNQTVGNAIFIADSEISLANQLMGRIPGVQIRGAISFGNNSYEPPKIELKKILVSASVQVKFILR